MSTPRVTTLADLVASAISAAWQPVLPDFVKRVYGHEVDLQAEDLVGRQVYVVPFRYGTQDLFSRKADMGLRTVSILTAERYDETGGDGLPLPGPVPADWVDARAYWVEQQVFYLLENPRSALYSQSGALAGWIPRTAEVDPVADQDYLRQSNVFFSVVTIEYVEDYTP